MMKSFDSVDCMFEVASRIPDFLVFRRITGPLSLVLELVVVKSRVDNFVEFEFVFSFYLNRRGGVLDSVRETCCLRRVPGERCGMCCVFSSRIEGPIDRRWSLLLL